MINNRSLFFLIFAIVCLSILSTCERDTPEPGSLNERSSSTQTETSPSNDLSASDLRGAALNGNIDLVREAIEQGVDIQETDELDRTALMFAAYNGHTEIVQLLAENGSEITRPNSEGRTPLMFASSGPFPETVEYLLKNGAEPNSKDSIEGWTPLMYAAAEGNREVVEILLEHGADPNLEDTDGETAIDFAANNGHSEVVTLLKN